MSYFPLPLDAYAEFKALFDRSYASGPSPLPTPNPTKSFWTHPGLSRDWPYDSNDPEGCKRINPYASEGSEGHLTSEADVVIIGGGITGVSVALELGRLVREEKTGPGLKVVILEARDFCSGATGRNGGHLTAAISHNYSSLAKLYSPEEVRRCFALEEHTTTAILSLIEKYGWADYVDLVEGGHCVLLFSEREAREAKEDWKKAIEAGVTTKDQVQWLTTEETKQEYGASYPMYRTGGHNLWPLKLVTRMFELARDGGSGNKQETETVEANSKDAIPLPAPNNLVGGMRKLFSNFLPSQQSNPTNQNTNTKTDSNNNQRPDAPDAYQLILHTHTAVHSVHPNEEDPSSFRWSVHTPRGNIKAKHIVYATNAYTSHLLPHLSGPDGIVPVRGQAVAIRAKVGYTDEGWKGEGDHKGLSRSGWSGNEGFEYWFPRPHPKSVHQHQPDHQKLDGDKDPNDGLKRPLIILGGARETLKDGGYGMYETDDSVLDPGASRGLRVFLGHVFPGKFPSMDGRDEGQSTDGVEVEWSGIMGFTKSGDPFVSPSDVQLLRRSFAHSYKGGTSQRRKWRRNKGTVHCCRLYGSWYAAGLWMRRSTGIAYLEGYLSS
ncbi:hypothetical protein FRC20_002532 [Serendipita sp. 405]|nr:hypothetical protein FRC20_002532 [Serendipita sp. 405]